MLALKRLLFCVLLSIFLTVVFVSCVTYYEPVSLAHVPFFSFKEHQVKNPNFFVLGSYDLHTNLWITDDEKACYVNLSFFDGQRNQKILNLEVSVENFKTRQKAYELQDVVLSYAHCNELDPKRTEQQFKISLPSIKMDTANCYSLRYTYKLKEELKTPKQVCIKIKADYKSDGEVKHFKDSVMFQKQTGFAFH